MPTRLATKTAGTFVGGLCTSIALACAAGDFDFDQGRYVKDSAIEGLAGPVRELREREYLGDKLYQVSKKEFDRDGELSRSTYYVNGSNCGESTFEHDSRGYRTAERRSSGKTGSGGSDCDGMKPSSQRQMKLELNERGNLSAEHLTHGPDGRGWSNTYEYDSSNRIRRVLRKLESDRMEDVYSYANDSRGVWVKRRHTASFDGGKVTFDVKREVLYSQDGKFLEATQVPDDVISHTGSEVRHYSDAGYLLKKTGSRPSEFKEHDRYGNWTVQVRPAGRIVREIAYWR